MYNNQVLLYNNSKLNFKYPLLINIELLNPHKTMSIKVRLNINLQLIRVCVRYRRDLVGFAEGRSDVE